MFWSKKRISESFEQRIKSIIEVSSLDGYKNKNSEVAYYLCLDVRFLLTPITNRHKNIVDTMPKPRMCKFSILRM